MAKSHGWDLESIKNYVPFDQRSREEQRIAEYHRRRAEIYENPLSQCSKWEFIEMSNLANEFDDLINEYGECPVEEILEWADD